MFRLCVEEVSKSFPSNGSKLQVLNGIGLAVKPQQFVGIIGPSGCGKTTLLNIISGLFPPDKGKIRINGKAVKDRRGTIAYMQQDDLLFPWRTVLDNAILGLEVQGKSKAIARNRARKLLVQFGLGEFMERYPAQLSGGMRQRVALVRTLLTGKDILLLDEPFGALDAMTRSAMHGWLLKCWQNFDRTILFVTHDVEEAVKLCDRVFVLSNRPATVKATIDIPLTRPREITEKEFVRVKGKLLNLIQEEMDEQPFS